VEPIRKLRKSGPALLCALVSGGIGAQTISTVAGTNWTFPTPPIPALQAPLGLAYGYAPAGVAVDSHGNRYIADPLNARVFKVDASGTLTVAAGTGVSGYSGDGGPASSATLDLPFGIAVDKSGNLYIADTYNAVIRMVNVSGIINTVAGTLPIGGYSGDNGPAIRAELNSPEGVAVDADGNLFIADTGNNVIRKVDTNSIITTVAGILGYGYSGDNGPATLAHLSLPKGVAVDASGNLFIADTFNHRIREVNSSGEIVTVAGNGTPGFSGDSDLAIFAQLNYPAGLTVDASGNLFIADTQNNRIRQVNEHGFIGTVAGTATYGYSGDSGPAIGAELNYPGGIAADASGNLFIADLYNSRIRQVNAAGIISTIAGNGDYRYSGDGGRAASATLDSPFGMAADALGNVFVADVYNNRIRKITPAGIITTVVGNGIASYSGDDGLATAASLFFPYAVAVDSSGNLFIADTYNSVIRKVSAGGTINTVAGNGRSGYSGDNGPAINAQLNFPTGIAVDASGNLFIAEPYNLVVRKVDSSGTITTVAGNGGGGYSGDNGPATSAHLNQPSAVAVDASGNLFISDTYNFVIRKVNTRGIITTFAGNGSGGYSGDNGPAASAELEYVYGICVDRLSNLFIADRQVIRKVNTSGIITTVAGNGTYGYSGDGGPATAAELSNSYGVTVDASGDLFIADTNNYRIREVVAAETIASPAIAGIVGSAGFQAGVVPGSWMTIIGTNLSPVTDTWANAIVAGNLPTSVDGVTVTVGGQYAYVDYISPTQINAVAPNVGSGTAPVIVTSPTGTSLQFMSVAQALQPAFFQWGSYAAATHQDFTLAAKNGTFSGVTTVPAKPGDVIILWGTGFGPTNPSAPAGVEAPSSTTYYTANTVTVTLGNTPALVYGAALAPGYAGLYQVAIQIPASLANGDYPVVATISGVQSPSSLITVQE